MASTPHVEELCTAFYAKVMGQPSLPPGICCRDTGESYDAFLEHLSKASGIERPMREDLAKIDEDRMKKGSNEDWMNPNDPDAKISKMKDGRTHLAYKAEHAVDMETSAILAITLHGSSEGNTQTQGETEEEAKDVLADVLEDPAAGAGVSDDAFSEVVADKGYHSNAVLKGYQDQDIRTYISEPARGRRRWVGKPEEQAVTHANRRRIRGLRGQRLLRTRGEKIERSFAHCYTTGGMRRLHLRGEQNALKRLLLHAAGYNLGLLTRQMYRRQASGPAGPCGDLEGAKEPLEQAGPSTCLVLPFLWLWKVLQKVEESRKTSLSAIESCCVVEHCYPNDVRSKPAFATGR